MVRKETYPHELIGEEIEVTDSKNKSNLGVKGKVIDETKETITIQMDDQKVILMKKIITFKLAKSGKIISGDQIAKRPEDRLK
ncbi:MAG: ribonuclease P protein subunit [Nanoarchaeota archaeon]